MATENVYIIDKKSSPTLIAERYNYILSPLTYNLLPDSYISIHQWDNSSWFVLCFDINRFSRLIADWSVENMKLEVTP